MNDNPMTPAPPLWALTRDHHVLPAERVKAVDCLYVAPEGSDGWRVPGQEGGPPERATIVVGRMRGRGDRGGEGSKL
jgi:hypothetical protein